MTREERRQRTAGFIAVLVLQLLVYGFLILTRRLPKGHDTLSIFLLQYLFLAHPGPGTAALWVPWLAHGLPSTWFADLQSGLLQNVLLLAGGVPPGTPMLPIFYAGLFLEDLVFVIGVWRLAGRFYRTPAAQFLVALTAVGSSLWVSNIYWNHRLVYAVPMILSLCLDALETGSRWKLFLAVSLMGLQGTGNPPYIPVLSALAVALFLGVYVILYRKQLRPRLARLRPRPSDAAWIVAMALVVASILTFSLEGLGTIRQYHAGRAPDGSVPINAYLTFPGSLNPLRYLDLLLGLTPTKDYSLYCGICTVLLAALSFFLRPGRAVGLFGVCTLILLLFSMGYLSIVAVSGYYAVYPLHYFRYVSLVVPLVKLHLILLSGFGFEALWEGRGSPGGVRRWATFAGILSAIVGVQLFCLRLVGDDPSNPVTTVLHRLVGGLAVREVQSPSAWGIAAVAAAAFATAVLAVASRQGRGSARLLVGLVVLLHTADLFRWRLGILGDETLPLPDPLYAALEVRPLPYLARRAIAETDDPHYREFSRAVFETGSTSGTLYDYCDAFLHREPPVSRFFVTQWAASVDLLSRAQAGRGSTSPDGGRPFFWHDASWGHSRPEPFMKMIGATRDKLQLFSGAHFCGSDDEVAEFMNRPAFKGDVLFVSAPAGGRTDPLEASLEELDERLPGSPRMLEFSPDRALVEAVVPDSLPHAWLVYCDAWNPGWRATVNGTPAPVERANLAYKVVRLGPGRNLVEFRFRAPARRVAGWGVGLLSLFWCGVLAATTAGLLRGDSGPDLGAEPPGAGTGSPAVPGRSL